MLNRFASLVLMAALAATLCATSAFANTPSDPPGSGSITCGTETPSTAVSSTIPATSGPRKNEKLGAAVLKLVADSKAGKVAPPKRSQIQPAQRNNLSKGTKIAIGVGIAVAVVAVVLVIRSPILNDGR